jgi:hypothetical protein
LTLIYRGNPENPFKQDASWLGQFAISVCGFVDAKRIGTDSVRSPKPTGGKMALFLKVFSAGIRPSEAHDKILRERKITKTGSPLSGSLPASAVASPLAKASAENEAMADKGGGERKSGAYI